VVFALGVVIEGYFIAVRGRFDDASLAIMGCAALFLFSGTAAMISGMRRRSLKVLFCVEGLIWTSGGKRIAARWRDLDRVDVQMDKSMYRRGQVAAYRVMLVSGKTIDLARYSVCELERLMKRINIEMSIPPEQRGRREPPTRETALALATGALPGEAVVDLGSDVEVFRPRTRRLWRNIILGASMTIAGGVGLGAFLYVTGVNLNVRTLPRVLVVLAVILFFGLGVIVRSWRTLSYRLAVSRNGLVEIHGRRTQTYRWDEIVRVDYYEGRHQTPKLTAHMKSGHEVSMDGTILEDVGRLADLIREETTKRSIPWVRTFE
jgi:hypothetical protein